MPGQEVDQRNLGQRFWQKNVCHINRTGRMRWIMVDGGSRYGMIDDHDRCEWVNVSSGTSSPVLSQRKSRDPKIVVVIVHYIALKVSYACDSSTIS